MRSSKAFFLTSAGAAVLTLVMTLGTFAQSSWVARSENIVGFKKILSPGGSFILGSIPFESGNADIQQLIGPQMTARRSATKADNLYTWDGAKQSYNQYFLKKDAGGVGNHLWVTMGGIVPATQQMSAGSAYWFLNRQLDDETLTVAGDVVHEVVVTNVIFPGLTMLSYPFSSDIRIQDITFQNAIARNLATKADNLYIWDSERQTYDHFYYKKDASGVGNHEWVDIEGGSVATQFLSLGQGFWYQSRAKDPVEWVQGQLNTID